MTINRDDAYVKTLQRALDRVLDLQRFAEQKNASLLAFSSVWIAGLVNLLSSNRRPPHGFNTASIAALALFVIAAMIAIASLLPRFVSDAAEHDDASNMLFFGDIARVPIAAYAGEARRRYFPPDGTFASETLMTDLSRQIAIVSRISMRKYRLFNRAAVAVLLGIASFTVPIVGLMADALR